jgi:hypothetical protein
VKYLHLKEQSIREAWIIKGTRLWICHYSVSSVSI